MSVSSEVLKAINARLKEIFPQVNIYNDETEQGVVEPCFLVRILDERKKSRIGESRWATTFSAEIIYLEKDVKQMGIQEVREALLFSLNDWEAWPGGGYMRSQNEDTVVSFEDHALIYTADFIVPMYRTGQKAEPMTHRVVKPYLDYIPIDESIPERDPNMWVSGEGDQDKDGIPDMIEPKHPKDPGEPEWKDPVINKTDEEKKAEETGLMEHLKQFGRIR